MWLWENLPKGEQTLRTERLRFMGVEERHQLSGYEGGFVAGVLAVLNWCLARRFDDCDPPNKVLIDGGLKWW